MKIVVCTKRDLAGALVLNHLMPHLAGDEVRVLLSDKTRPVEKAVPELAEIKFLERDLPLDRLFPLVDRVGADDAPLATFLGIARRYGVPVRIIADINGAEAEAELRAFAPDLMLSARFSLIFKPNVFDIPRFGTWNVHPGALPRYAGLFAPFRGLMDGSDRLGCTLHRVDAGIDTGPVQGIGWLEVERARSLLWHVVNAYRPGLELFVDMLADIRAGKPPRPKAQDAAGRVYGTLPDADAFIDFRQRGMRVYDHGEYLDMITGFLPAGMTLPTDLFAVEKVGAPCCCARA